MSRHQTFPPVEVEAESAYDAEGIAEVRCMHIDEPDTEDWQVESLEEDKHDTSSAM